MGSSFIVEVVFLCYGGDDGKNYSDMSYSSKKNLLAHFRNYYRKN